MTFLYTKRLSKICRSFKHLWDSCLRISVFVYKGKLLTVALEDLLIHLILSFSNDDESKLLAFVRSWKAFLTTVSWVSCVTMIKFHSVASAAQTHRSSRNENKLYNKSVFLVFYEFLNQTISSWSWRTDNASKGMEETKVEVTKVAVRHETAHRENQ